MWTPLIGQEGPARRGRRGPAPSLRHPPSRATARRARALQPAVVFGGALSHGLFLVHEDHDSYPAQPPADVEPRRVEGSRAPLRNGGEEFRSSHPTRPKSLICRFGNTASHTPCRELHRTQITSPTPAPSVLRGNPTLGRGRRRFYFIFNTPHSFLYVEVTDYTTVT
ncbi:TPA: hypothetical protein BOS_16674 [Bos taurus]|nr:TPA: hypothetical protein BOS_16674 [Bos taurus]